MSDKAKKDRKVILESGIEVKPVYTADDLAESDAGAQIGKPGEYPFTRGIHPQMYRQRVFTMRQYSGFATAAKTNERFKYLIANGQTGLNVAFDLPTQNGLDSDDPRAAGEVGRVGMAIDTLADFEVAFDGIPIDTVTVSLTINSVAAVMIAMYQVVAEKQGRDINQLRGTAQNDILKEYIGRGTWIFPVRPSVKLIADTIEYCATQMPKYSPVSVCGYHIRESGANPAQEIAYAFAIAKAYAKEATDRGVDVNAFLSRFSYNFNVYGNLWEQVAKFRAARRLWAKICKNELGATDPKAMWLRMIAGGGGSGLTIEQPENNIVRGAYYALAAALGGAQTMALCSYDEAYTIPTEKAARISLRTMQILVEEMGLADTVDPLAGSYYIESLTDAMEEKIVGYMKSVDARGGILVAVEQGDIQREVARQAFENEKKLQSGETVKVGVNKYRIDEVEPEVAMHPFDQKGADEQVARLQRVRAGRDTARAEKTLATLQEQAAMDEVNLMPALVDCVRAYASVGEITRVLKNVYGEFREPVAL